MNGQTPQPPQKTRPPSSGRPARKSVQSKESRFIGYVVLGFGVLAVITVLILAFGGRQASKTAEVPEAKTETATNAQALIADLNTAPATIKAREKKELYFERDADLDAGDMEGDWQAAIGRYTAVLQIRKDVFQLILATPDPASPRLYSSGTYKVLEDIVLLTPRMDWPEPATAGGKAASYSKLTRAPFPVLARFDGDKMLWQNVPTSETRVLAPYTSPLFMSEDVGVAVWTRLKKD